jgi:RNA polymerase-binding transcription factor DksA
MNKLRITGLLIDKKTKHKRRVLTEKKLDNIVASSNPRTEEELKENIRREISHIAAENLQKVNQNFFCWCEGCLRVEGLHFQHIL